jgi:uncharacterized protein (DUF1684 family)
MTFNTNRDGDSFEIIGASYKVSDTQVNTGHIDVSSPVENGPHDNLLNQHRRRKHVVLTISICGCFYLKRLNVAASDLVALLRRSSSFVFTLGTAFS